MKAVKYIRQILLLCELFSASMLMSQNFGPYATAVWIDQVGVSSQFYNTSSIAKTIYTAQQHAINQGGGDWTNVNFLGRYFGSHLANSSDLLFRGTQLKTFKQFNGNNCTPEFNYIIYPTGNRPLTPIFNSLSIDFFVNCDLGTSVFPDIPGDGPCNTAGYQKWQTLSLSPNSEISDLTLRNEGNYTMELYYRVPGSNTNPNGCNENYLENNGGINYKATFTICPTLTFTSKTNPDSCGGKGTIIMSTNGIADGSYSDRFYYEDIDGTHLFKNVIVNSNVATATVIAGEYNNIRYWVTGGCYPTTEFDIVLIDPDLPTAPVIGTLTQPTCATPTGSVQLSSLPAGNWVLTSSSGSSVSGNTTNFLYTGLAPSGSYTITVTNEVLCTSAPSVLFTVNALPPPPPVPSVAGVTQPTCAVNSGTIQFNAQANVEYSVGFGFQLLSTFSGLAPGTYTLTVRSTTDNACRTNATSPVTINVVPDAPVNPVAASVIQPTCAIPTGTITISLQTAVEYSINGVTWQAGNVFNNLNPGNYTLFVRNLSDVSCVTPSASLVTINVVPDAPIIPVAGSVIQPSCANPTGTISIALQTAVEYSINGVTWQAGNVFNNLNPGNYTLYVRNLSDVSCVTPSASLVTINVVPDAPAIPVAASVIQPSCANPTGTITIALQTGVEYSVNGVTWQAGNVFNNLNPGNYTLFVRNLSDVSCVTPSATLVSINIVPDAPVIPVAANVVQPTCAIPTGTITIALQNAVEYSVNGVTWQAGNVFNNLNPGNYNLYVRSLSDVSCVTPSAFLVTINVVPDTPTIPVAASVVQPTCAIPTGTITIELQSFVEYSINGVTWQAENVFNNLNPGNYTLYVRNLSDNSCVTPSNSLVTINVVPDAPIIPVAANVVQPTCAIPTGTITIAMQKAVEYSVNGVTWQASNIFTGLNSGNYTLYVRNLSDVSCVTTSASLVTINVVPDAPTIPVAASVVQPTCATPTGTITIALQSAVEYSVNGVTWQAGNVFNNLNPGNYTLYVRNLSDVSCVTPSASLVTINVVPDAPIIPVAASVIQPSCANPTGTISIALQTAVEYSINGVTWQAGNVFNNLNPGNYTLYVRNLSDNSCVSPSATMININIVPEAPAIPLAASVVQPSCATPTGTIAIALQTGVEYSVNGVAWQLSNTFMDLVPSSDYTLSVRNIADHTCAQSSILKVGILGVLCANDDNFHASSGFSGGVVGNLFDNDTYNLIAVVPSTLNLTLNSVVPGINVNTTTGIITVEPLTSAGTYVFTYQICEKLHPSNCDEASVTVVVDPTSDLSITKTDGTNTYTPGTITTYTLEVVNKGLDGVTNALVTDNLPATTSGSWKATFEGGASGNAIGNGSLNELVQIPVDGKITYTVLVNIPSAYTGNLTNTAVVSNPPTVADNDLTNNISTDTNIQSSLVNLSIVKTSSLNFVTAGQTVNYKLIVQNTGLSDAHQVKVSDILNDGLSFQSATEGGTLNGNSVNWLFEDLVAGNSLTLTVTVKVNPDVANGTMITNIGRIESDETTFVTSVPTVIQVVSDFTLLPDLVVLDEDNGLNIGVLNNDTISNQNIVITVLPADKPINGVVTINPDGTVSYVPYPDFNGTDSFVYTVTATYSDGSTKTGQETVTITVIAIADIKDDVASVNEDESVNIQVLSNDSFQGTYGTNYVVSSTTNPVHGKIVLLPNGTVTYTTDPNYNGNDSFSYTVTVSFPNGLTNAETATVYVTVISVSDPVTAINDVAFVNENDTVIIAVLVNDDFGFDPPAIGSITCTDGQHGNTWVDNNDTPNDPTDDKVVYIPEPNFDGVDAFSYTICSSNTLCAVATVNVTVNDLGKLVYVTKTATTPELRKDGTFSLIYSIIIGNKTTNAIRNIQLVDDLTKTFPSPISFNVELISAGDKLKANSLYDGIYELNTLQGNGKLEGGEIDSIQIRLQIDPNGFSGKVYNQGILNGYSLVDGHIHNFRSDDPTGMGVLPRLTMSDIPAIEMFIPDAFSPNGDQYNERFVIIHSTQFTIKLQVFSRWGDVVYEDNNYQNDWDGKGTGKYADKDLPGGTYYYVVEQRNSITGEKKQYSGYLTLRR